MSNYFAELPPEEQAKMAQIAAKYLPLIPGAEPPDIYDKNTLWQIIYWQEIETEILEAHSAWLAKVKAAVERSGREWNRESFLRFCTLREHE